MQGCVKDSLLLFRPNSKSAAIFETQEKNAAILPSSTESIAAAYCGHGLAKPTFLLIRHAPGRQELPEVTRPQRPIISSWLAIRG